MRRAPEQLAEPQDEDIFDLRHRDRPPEQRLERRDAVIGNSAGDDETEEIEVRVHVERKPVAGDPARNADADGAYLLGPTWCIHPRAREASHTTGRHAEIGADANHQLLEIPHVRVHVAPIRLEVDDGIAHELPGAVVGHIAAAPRFVHVDAAGRQHLRRRDDVRAGAVRFYAERDDVRVLEQDQDVRDPVRFPILDECALQREPLGSA